MTTVLGCCLVVAAVLTGLPGRAAGSRLSVALPALVDSTALTTWVAGLADRRLVLGAAGAGAALGWLTGGPVAGLVGAVYGALAGRALVRRRSARRRAAVRARSLDDLGAVAADLRAGLPPVSAPALPAVPDDGLRVAGAVFVLAERTGAPVADLIDRIEADARAADRARASAAAQASGAQATAVLLAALPLAGIAIGYSIGVDPLRVLFHTVPGAVCAAGAVVLQGAGLLWAERLIGGAAR